MNIANWITSNQLGFVTMFTFLWIFISIIYSVPNYHYSAKFFDT